MTWSKTYRGFYPGDILNVQVNKENQSGIGPWSAIVQHTVGTLDTPGEIPASASVLNHGDAFLLSWDNVPDRDVTGYWIKINTANSLSGSKLYKRVRKPARSGQIKIGDVCLSDGSSPLLYGVDYYFFVGTSSGDNIDSITATACTENPMRAVKAWELQHFTTPWKMTGRHNYSYRVIVPGDDEKHVVATGKVALLQGYALKGDGTGAHCWIGCDDDDDGDYFEIDFTTSSTIQLVGPHVTNGLYIAAGGTFFIKLESALGSGEARMRILEFDADPLIDVIKHDFSASYVVPSGKRLVITYLWSNQAPPIYLRVKEGATWYDVYDITADSWNVGKGVLIFEAGMEIGASGGAIFTGYLLAGVE